MTRSLAVLAALSLLVAGCTADDAQADSPASPEASPTTPAAQTPTLEPELAALYSQSVTWQPCRGDFECATVQVPLDYSDPSGERLEIALLRSPATSPGRRVGSLLVNPGGPGGSGVDFATVDTAASPALRQVYDIVGFDPRGVGLSSPVECVTDAELDETLNEGDATPDTPEEVAEALDGQQEFVTNCRERAGDLLPHVGTPNVARDLDIIRAALGDERLTYLGTSYGTTIGLEYAREFPTRVGRMVLDAALDPTRGWPELQLEQTAGLDTSLRRFAEWCVATGCSLGTTTQQVLAVVDRVLEATDAEPLPTESRPLTQVLAFYGIIAPLYSPPDQGFPVLEVALAQADAGDGSTLLTLADLQLRRSADGEFAGNTYQGAFTAVNCLDLPHEADVADVQAAIPEFRQASPQMGELRAWSLLSCTGWPVASPGLAGPVRAEGAPPIVVLGATEDPITPYAWSVEVAEQLESGVLVTFESTGHSAYIKGSACIDAAVDAYLLDGVVPEDGLRCS